MNLIFCRNKHSAMHSISLSPAGLGVLAAVILLLPAVVGGTLVHWWMGVQSERHHDQALIELRQEVVAQRQEVEALRVYSMERIESIAPRVGELHANLVRLNGLGERLANIANLSDEFDFESPPPAGGPLMEMEESPPAFLVDDLEMELDSLEQKIEQRLLQLRLLYGYMTNQKFAEQAYIAGRPAIPSQSWMTSGFGWRDDPDPLIGRRTWHNGLDFGGVENSPVPATGAGVVVFAGENGGFGNMVEIDHGNGYRTRYAHMNEISVYKGDLVQRGDTLGLMGCTGRCFGTHVHYEVWRNGRAVDPLPYVRRDPR